MSHNEPPPTESRVAQSNPLGPLARANAIAAYNWLMSYSPDHLGGVEYAVQNGSTPDEIYRFMLRDTFQQEIAHRCRLAARWLIEQGER